MACLRTPRAASRWALPHTSSFIYFVISFFHFLATISGELKIVISQPRNKTRRCMRIRTVRRDV